MDAPRLGARSLAALARQCLGAAMLTIALASCSSASRDEMAQDVLKNDPGFKTILDHRDAIQHQVDQLREQLEAQRMSVEQQIHRLQSELQEARNRMRGQIETLTQELIPQREQLQLEIRTLTNHIRTQEATVQGLKRTIADMERAQHRPGPPPAAANPARQLPPTGGAVTDQLADAQRELQHALNVLTASQARRHLLQYKLRLLQLH